MDIIPYLFNYPGSACPFKNETHEANYFTFKVKGTKCVLTPARVCRIMLEK